MGHTGYVGLDRWSLIDDVVRDGKSLSAVDIVREALPSILRLPGNVPTFKYLRQAGFLTKSGAIRKRANVDPKIVRMANSHRSGSPAGSSYKRTARTRLADISGIAELEERLGVDDVYKFGTCLPPDRVDIDELRAFLRRNQGSLEDDWSKTQYAKLVCYLDWLEYGREA